MVPDDWLWAGIIASILSLAALQPIVYRFFAEQFWPYQIRFTYYHQIAQAGNGVVFNIRIRNRTGDPAYFRIGARYTIDPALDVRSFRFIHTSMYRHVPLNEPFSGHLALAPFELDSVLIRYTPTVRGHFQFVVELTEFSHWSRYPRLVAFNRRVLRRKNPNLHLFEYKHEIEFTALTWSVSPDQVASVIGRALTQEERDLDAEIDKKMQAVSAPPADLTGGFEKQA